MKLFFNPGQKRDEIYCRKARDEVDKRMQRTPKSESDMKAKMILATFLATSRGEDDNENF